MDRAWPVHLQVVPTLEDCLADNDDELSDVPDDFYDL